MQYRSKLIIIIASYLLLSTNANANANANDKIVNNQDLLDDEVYYGKGQANYGLQEYNDTTNNCDVALKYKPDDAEEYISKAYTLAELGRYQEAITNCDLALKYKPDYADAYLEKGYILSKLNKHKEAEDNFKLIIKYQPDFIEQYESLMNKVNNGYPARYLEKRLTLLKKYLASNKHDN